MIGKKISHYNLLEKLGEGGMGVVYKARDLSLNREVALKFLPAHLTEDEECRKHFKKEARAASALDHPNICTIHEVNEIRISPKKKGSGQLYICMAYYKGESLREKIKKGPIPVREALNICQQIARGLRAAHDKKIIHRDIKPGNILITDRGEVKIVDFGLAKLAGEKVTETFSTRGTVAYMAPEFLRGMSADESIDIWSLGVLLFEMLTGYLPFEGEYPEPMMYSIINEEPPSLSRFLHNVPESLQIIMDKFLKKDPVNRYRNLDELFSDLKSYMPELAGHDTRIFKRKLKSIPDKRILISGFLIILLIGILLVYNRLFDFSTIKTKPIAVISFENQTGEKQYDYLQKAIPNLLITSLEQSGYLRVATWERLNDLLKQQGIRDVDIINPELGFKLCKMDGIENIVLGSYTRAGDIFAVDIKILDVKSKELMLSAQTHGYGISSILTHQINELSDNIAKELGLPDETEVTIRPLSEVTTSSMEAYNYFIRGREEWEKRNIQSSRQFFEKAVKLDTTFATAYSYLGKAYYTLSNPKKGNMFLQKAEKYSNKATEKERLYIEVASAIFLENNSEKRFDLEHKITKKYPQEKRAHLDLAYYCYTRRKLYTQALDRFEKVIELDPNFGLAFNQLALTYMEMGEYERAIRSFERYATLNPGDANVFDSTGELYLRMGELDQALAKYKEAFEVDPQCFTACRTISYIYGIKENYDESLKWIDQYIKIAPSAGIKARGHLYKAFYCFWLGRFVQSQHELQIAADYYNEVENRDGLGYIDWIKSWFYFYSEDLVNANKHFKKWYDFREKDYSQYTARHQAELCFFSGLTDLYGGKITSSKARLEKIKELMPKVDLENKDRLKFYCNTLNTELLLSQDLPEKITGISDQVPTLQIPPVGTISLITYNLPFPKLRDFSARRNLHNGNLDEAIVEYEKLITLESKKNKDRRLIHPTTYFKLAQLYEEKGRTDKAVGYYQKFLEIWKKSDDGIPEIIEAKKSLTDFGRMN